MDPDALLADRLLADLDADQRRAVTAEARLVAVIAGAGSGKTRVLTRRVAWRIATGSADAAHHLVLTFTREAAGELRRRLPALGLSARVTAGTFHSIAHGLLRQRWADLEIRAPQLVPERERLLAQLTGARGDALEALVHDVNWASARGLDGPAFARAVSAGAYHPATEVGRVVDVLAAYTAAKRERGHIDLDDLLLLLAQEMERDARYREAVQWRYRHVLVDEAQDLNPLQQRVVRLLAEPGDLFLVGDPAQAIYGFNGADPRLLVDVEQHFPGVEIVRLPVNYRSTPQIVDFGAHVLATGAQLGPVAAALRSARGDGPVVRVIGADDEHAEAACIVGLLAGLDPGLLRTSQVAVLARTHHTLRAITAAIDAAGVPRRQAADGPNSPLLPHLSAAYRVRTADQLRHWAHDLLERVADEATEHAVEETAGGGAARDRSPAELVGRAVLDYLGEHPTGDGAGLRTWVAATDPFGATSRGVELLTFHAAKGREWHTVVLAGCETSLVPHRSARTRTARAEEARLLYVAMTRATDALIITWATRRGGYQRKPSPFLEGFVSAAPPSVPPPADLLARHRPMEDDVIARLRAWRADAARAVDVLPESLLTDRELAAIATQRPRSARQLADLTGIGAMTAERLWPALARVLDPSE